MTLKEFVYNFLQPGIFARFQTYQTDMPHISEDYVRIYSRLVKFEFYEDHLEASHKYRLDRPEYNAHYADPKFNQDMIRNWMYSNDIKDRQKTRLKIKQ